MGVPLTNFTVLKYIADGVERKEGTRQSIEMELALDALKSYSVFAFVLHDPNAHGEFHEFFQRQFEDLHHSTGEHLVFFGLADAPKMKTLVGRKNAYADIRDMISEYEAEEKSNVDLSYSAFALANSLKIKPEKLPAIIVTNDFRLRSFRYYKTCPNEMEKQMSRLTSISRKMYLHRQLDSMDLVKEQKLFTQYLDEAELDLCKGMGIALLTESLARALSDVMSFIVQSEGGGDYTTREVHKIAREQKQSSLNRVIDSLQALKRTIAEVDKDDLENQPLFSVIEELNIKLATFLAMLEKRDVPLLKEQIPLKEKWLDTHSLRLLQTAIEVEAFLQTRKIKLDFSSSAICLGKMFEQEINNSFVHWFRKQQSIELPEYYNRVQPRKRAFVKPNFPKEHRFYPGSPINLNSERHGEWAPPELGKSKNLAIYNLSEKDWLQLGINDDKAFLRDWASIHELRNKAAHTEEVTVKDLTKMKTALTNMATTNAFEKLSELKNAFQNKALLN